MDVPQEELARALFGLDGAEVDEVLRQQSAAYTAHMQALRQMLTAEQARLGQLLTHAATIERQVAVQRSLAVQLEESLRRAGETAPIIEDAIQQRTRLIEDAAAERQQARREQIDQLNELVRLKLRLLESATEQICKLAPEERDEVSGSSGRSENSTEDSTKDSTEENAEDSLMSHKNAQDITKASGEARVTISAASTPVAGASAASSPTTPPTATLTSTATASAAQVEAGLRSRINANIVRLLAGKVVGEDLRDADDRVIAARGTPITEDVAARAQAAGVLPDLILHMTWPEEARR